MESHSALYSQSWPGAGVSYIVSTEITSAQVKIKDVLKHAEGMSNSQSI